MLIVNCRRFYMDDKALVIMLSSVVFLVSCGYTYRVLQNPHSYLSIIITTFATNSLHSSNSRLTLHGFIIKAKKLRKVFLAMTEQSTCQIIVMGDENQ